MQGQTGANLEIFGGAFGDAGEQRVAGDIEFDQHMARRVGRAKIDDGGGNAVQNAALHLRHQRQADIAGVNAAT